MSSFLPPFLIYHNQYGLLTCRIHQIALHPTKILDHITKHHHDITLAQSDLDSLGVKPLVSSLHLIQEAQPITPIPSLHDPQAGFQCKQCKILRLSQQKMRNHISETHDIKGFTSQDSEMLGCLVQALEGSAYLFQVTRLTQLSGSTLPTRKRTREPSLISPTSRPTPQRSRVQSPPLLPLPDQPQASTIHQSFLMKFHAQRQSLKKSRVIRTLGATHESRSFFNESQYAIFLDGRDATDLEGLFRLDDPDQMTWLSIILHHLILIGQNQMKNTTTQSLAALNSFSQDPAHQMSLRPMRRLQNAASLKKYCLIFRAFIIFLLNSFNHIKGGGPASYLGLYTLSAGEPDALKTLESFLLGLPSPKSIRPTQPSDSGLDLDLGLGLDLDLDSDSDLDSGDESAFTLGQATSENPLVQQGVGLITKLTLLLAQREVKNQQEVPLYAFRACFSRNYSYDHFKPLDQISHSFSAIIKCHQFIFLYWLHSDPYSESAESPNEPMVIFIRKWMTKHFIGQSESPLGHVLVLRALALHLVRASSSLGKIHLLGPHTLKYGHVIVSQKTLQLFLVRSIGNLALTLSNELCLNFSYFYEVESTLNLGVAADHENISNLTNNWSVLSAYLTEGSHDFLLQKILLLSDWFNQVNSHGGPTLELSRSRAQTYLEASSGWLKKLLALCHVTSGAPARGTEINQVIWQNTSINPRNLFLDPVSKLFLIQLAYSKTFTHTGQEKEAVRALPQSISFLVLAYLAYIRPFEEFLLITIQGQLPKAHFLLFYDHQSGRPFSSKVLSRTLKNMTSEIISQPISLSPWRHLVQGFIRHGLGLHDPLTESSREDLDDEGLGADQMNHSRSTGLQTYGRNIASFQGVRADIQSALISFSQRWHAYLGVSPDQLILGTLFYDRSFSLHQLDQSRSPDLPQPTPEPRVLPLDQPIIKFHWPTPPKATPPRSTVSIGQFNEFMSLYGVPQAMPKSIRHSDDLGDLGDLGDLDQGQLVRQLDPSLPAANHQLELGLLTHMLREFFQDDQVTFRSPEQQQGFHLMMKSIPYLFLILPTAAGKTTLFLFGASLATSQVTIIIIPLISLKLDLSSKANALGLEPTIWLPENHHLNPRSRVVLVQIEHVIHPRFHAMADDLIMKRRLARIIWDECHLIPLAQSYRPIMKRAWHALALPIPMVFTSATLPHHLEVELKGMLHLGTLPYILRADLTLKNMSYRVVALPDRLPSAKYPGYLTQFIKSFEVEHGPFGPSARARANVIIFCRSKAQVNQFFDTLGPQVSRFHSDLDDDEKLNQLARFRASAPLLVATSGIGAGYDFPGVDLVIHFMPGAYEMTNFMQESGRAGRSPDTPAWSYCLVLPYQLRQNPNQEGSEPPEKIYFQQYLLDQICRRRVISRVFNSRALESCDPSWATCDLCSTRLGTLDSTREVIRKQEQLNALEIEFFTRAVKFWTSERCLICFLQHSGK